MISEFEASLDYSQSCIEKPCLEKTNKTKNSAAEIMGQRMKFSGVVPGKWNPRFPTPLQIMLLSCVLASFGPYTVTPL